MINLCYLKEQSNGTTNQRLIDFPQILTVDDLVIFPSIDSSFYSCNLNFHFINSSDINFEKFAYQEFKNLLLIDFDLLPTLILQKIVNLKSKKSEIIGISFDYYPQYKKMQLDLQEAKDIGLSFEQAIMFLILKENIDSTILVKYINRYQNNNIKIKEIDNILDVKKFLKY